MHDRASEAGKNVAHLQKLKMEIAFFFLQETHMATADHMKIKKYQYHRLHWKW